MAFLEVEDGLEVDQEDQVEVDQEDQVEVDQEDQVVMDQEEILKKKGKEAVALVLMVVGGTLGGTLVQV